MRKHMVGTARRTRRRRRPASCARQLTIFHRGGKRPGAGRKPKGARAGVPHRKRPALAPRFPVLVTARLFERMPSLRKDATLATLRRAFAAASERNGLRLIHFSIQSNHLHLIAEAHGAEALSRGMQGLLVRVARALNRLWGRKGSVFADRYHSRILRTPREVRHALAYVLNNARKHGCFFAGIDPFSSGRWFDG